MVGAAPRYRFRARIFAAGEFSVTPTNEQPDMLIEALRFAEALGRHHGCAGLARPLFARLCRDNEDFDGRGLRLFVVRGAVDLLGHDIEVRSTVGRGSCFSILAKIAYGASELARISPFASSAQDRELTCSAP
jgi:hypothetical protein